MDPITFACTVLITAEGTFRAGDVLKGIGSEYPWSQCIILGFSNPNKHGDVYAKMARPYVYASCVGTTSPGPLMGVEEFEVPASKLKAADILTKDGNTPMVAGSLRRDPYPSEIIDLTQKAA